MNRADPFTGYSFILRVIIYGLVPAFTLFQFVRLKRALHVFQLEGYKRGRFLRWCASSRRRALFLQPAGGKKPLVMTSRARRILVTATILTPLLVLVPSGAAHLLLGGAPADLVTWAVATVLVFIAAPHVLVAADVVLSPLQAVINGRYRSAALRTLRTVAPTVVGVTGSFGKTSTKFAIAGLAGAPDEVLATPGSFNTPLGVCRTVNELLGSDHKVFVVEMGAYHEGEIAELCRFVQPTIGVLTAIGPAHLERFGSIEAIVRAKSELIESLPPAGTAVLNVDDERVRKVADGLSGVGIVRYGLDRDSAPDITAEEVVVGPKGTTMLIKDIRSGSSLRATAPLLGRHAAGHVLAGVSVALTLGRDLGDLAGPIAGLSPVEHRLQLIEGAGGVTVIDDAFNSNPEGARAALEVLEAMPGEKKILVTPGIVELGEIQDEANEAFGRAAADVADVVIVVAPLNRDALCRGLDSSGRAVRVITVDSLQEATAQMKGVLSAGDVVLFENDLPDQYELP
ncbi:MAG TPA: UDP-N-acetylmuramoyl-tripeptide--D-alanyl-D-alanine ligase [Actinomycetota bacterium]|nr:UDP-N-acetylmuramoyl-tripeptide--D-alanyl-D-alanine ligase [Actinomycetota bacterium]